MNYASASYFHNILAIESIESCSEPPVSKNDLTVKKRFNVSTSFLSSSKRSSTFHKVLTGKVIIIPARHSGHVSSTLLHSVLSHE